MPVKAARTTTEALLFFLAFFLPGFVAQASMAGTGSISTLALLQSVLAGVPQVLLMAYVAGARGPFSSARWGLAPLAPRDAVVILLIVAVCFAIVTPFYALAVALPPRWTRSFLEGYRWGLQGPAQLPVALLFSLTAGYREEFYFRAYLLKRMEELGARQTVAIAASTALFCTGHVYEGPLGILVSLVLGVVFALTFLRRRNLHVIAIAHGLYNTIVLALSLVARSLPVGAAFRIFSAG